MTVPNCARELGEQIIMGSVGQLCADVNELFSLAMKICSLRIYDGIPELLANDSISSKTVKQAEESDIIEQVKKYISLHITDDITLEDLSEKFYFSQYHFSRMFKAKTGETLIHYIMRMKIERAVALLKQKHLKIYEVCNLVGYKNNYHFTEVFKRFTGYTPNAYRNLK
jgi:YesN/AraC family two-component response regulator